MPIFPSKKNRPWIVSNPKSVLQNRGYHDAFYCGQPWRKLRKVKLINEPLCVRCKEIGIIKEANVVDHIKPRRFYPELELSYTNLDSLCKKHHASKSGKEAHFTNKKDYIKKMGGAVFLHLMYVLLTVDALLYKVCQVLG